MSPHNLNQVTEIHYWLQRFELLKYLENDPKYRKSYPVEVLLLYYSRSIKWCSVQTKQVHSLVSND